jgi:hypothetical protein
MGGTRGEDPTGGGGEIYLVDPDGTAAALSGDSQPPRRASGRQAALLAVVALLAFGIGVGVGTHRTGPAGAAGQVTAPSTSHRSAPSDTGRVGAPTSNPANATAPSRTERTSAPTTLAARQPWPTAVGVCGYEMPVPLISGVLPLNGPTGLSVMAGGSPSRIPVDGGRAAKALFPNPVEALAPDGQGLVATSPVEQCSEESSAGSVLGLRLGDDGELSQIFPSAESHQSSLQPWGIVSGGNHAYLVATPPYDPNEAPTLNISADVYTLLATDGSGDSIALPAGLMPVAGWRDLVIGYFVSTAAETFGPIQIFDVTGGGIVAQLAAASPQLVAAGGHLAWFDSSCSSRCTVHRYDLDTGQRSDTEVTLARSEYGGVGALAAMSPDGRRVAMVTYDAAADSRYDLGHPGGPARFSVVDLDSGRITALPGVLRAPKTASGAAFSPDGAWLAIAVNDGPNTRVLLYDQDLRGPYDPGITVPASTAWNIPLVVEQP